MKANSNHIEFGTANQSVFEDGEKEFTGEGARSHNGFKPIEHADILGVRVSAINISAALRTFDHWIAEQIHNYVCVTGVHGVMESQRDRTVMDIHNKAGMVTPDGMPLVWLSRLQGFPNVDRVYGPDLMLAFCQHSVARNYRHYFYGGADGVPELLAERLQERFPGLIVAGVYSPPFRQLSAEEENEIIQTVNTAQADVVWIGLSTPKQEKWMAANVGRFSAPVMIGVGAAFDFNAGLKRQAPRWMQRSGLEWLFRLVTEPRRLWRRYMINNPQFLYLLLKDWFSK